MERCIRPELAPVAALPYGGGGRTLVGRTPPRAAETAEIDMLCRTSDGLFCGRKLLVAMAAEPGMEEWEKQVV